MLRKRGGGGGWLLMCAPVLVVRRHTMNVDARGVLHDNGECRGCVSFVLIFRGAQIQDTQVS